MAISLEQFVEQLIKMELVPDRELAAMFESATPKQPLDTAEQLAGALVRRKMLSVYQSQAIYKGKGNKLVLGNYVILDKLGEGGMGVVLKARHQRMDRVVALKLMSAEFTKSPEALKRFHREVRAAARLSHPNIVHAYDADEAKGVHYFVMEYVDGTDLSTLVKRHGPMPLETALTCIIQAARGLEYAHGRGVIHRDIKPANLLMATSALKTAALDQPGSSAIKILDMGLARVEGGIGDEGTSLDLTTTGTIMGTVDYMSPEQALETRTADARSDIYSLGCTFHYLLTGRALFNRDTVMKRLLAHREETVPSLADALEADRTEQITNAGHIPAGLRSPLAGVDSVFQRMVAKKPEDRYQSMAEVLVALQGCLEHAAVSSNSDSAADGSDLDLRQFLAGLNDEQTAGPGESEISPSMAQGGVGGSPDTKRDGVFEETFNQSLPNRLRRSFRARLARRATRIWIGAGLSIIAAVVLVVVFSRPNQLDPDSSEQNQTGNTAAAAGKSVGGARKKTDSAASITRKDGWVDLLARIDPTRDVPRSPVDGGAWERVGGALRSPVHQFARVAVPLDAPEAFRLRAEFTRQAGSDAVNFYLPVASRQVMLVVDGFEGKGLSGLHAVRRRYEPVPGITGVDKFRLQNGKRYRIEVNVNYAGDDATIEARVEGADGFSFTWTGPIRDLSLFDKRFDLYDSRLFGLGARDAVVDFHKLEILTITGEARWTRPAGVGPSSAPAKNHALSFNGRSSYVEVGSLKLDAYAETQPLTIEAYVTRKQPAVSNIVSWLGKAWIAVYNSGEEWGAGRLTSDGPLLHYKSDVPDSTMPMHIAAVWDGRQFQLFIDGKKQLMSRKRYVLLPTSGGMFIGGAPLEKLTGHTEPRWFAGVIDELRISRTARYTQDFKPKRRFTYDTETVALYHFDGGIGRKLVDSSGNGHHGAIHGAIWVNADGTPIKRQPPR